ncbi:MAG: carboxypeptidase regulatory-like domain-containing protein [Nitrospirae bacterium]|nr:carboxypeptidase regulatory-like domain-containing protein [Nitrospirota bacterium]
MKKGLSGVMAIVVLIGYLFFSGVADAGTVSFAGYSMEINGTAAETGGVLRLTTAGGGQAGSAFIDTPFMLDAHSSFSTFFQFRISGGNGSGGADGLAFILHNSPAGIDALGATGGGLGYMGIPNSFAVEFDTWTNSGYSDPNSNHIGIDVSGSVTSLATYSAPPDLNSGSPLYAWIDYNGITHLLEVYISNTSVKPDSPVISQVIDIYSFVGSQAYAGFSAGTGGLANVHDIEDLSFTGPAACTPPPSGMVSWWRAEDNALDFIGANDGTLMNGATYAVGMVNEAFSFDGVNDYVQIGARPDLVMTNTLTVDAWIYPTGPGSSIHGGIIVNKEGEYEMARYPDGTIQWAFANTVPGWTWINTGYVAPQNQWTHIALVYDAGTVSTYANGNLVHTYIGAGSIGDVQPAENDFRIGGRQVGDQFFRGLIDEVEIFNRALSGNEIAAIFNAGPEGKCVPVLTVNLDMPTGGTVKGGGISCPALTCIEEYSPGTSVILTATAKNSYKFRGWSGCDVPLRNKCTMKMTEAKEVTANFTGIYNIAGKVVNQTGLPMPNVTVTLESVAGGGGLPPDFVVSEAIVADISRLVVTDIYGKYKFTQLPNGSYKVTPGDVGFTFTPPNQKVTILDANVPGVNFRLMY